MVPAEELTQRIAILYEKLASSALEPDETIQLPTEFEDVDPKFIVEIIKEKRISEPDTLPIQHLKADMGTILDIGAHWGYTAASFRNVGSKCPILSFEALAPHRRCLQAIKDADDQYDFHIGALSDSVNKVSMYTIVANGSAVCGINSIGGATLTKDYAGLAAQAVQLYCVGQEHIDLKIGTYETTSRPLDEILRTTGFAVATRRIAMLKIDTEGHEAYVLRGALETLRSNLPLLMIEFEVGRVETVEMLRQLGYRPARRAGDKLSPYDGGEIVANNFFYHPTRLKEYCAIGLIELPKRGFWRNIFS